MGQRTSKICKRCKAVYNKSWYERNKAAHIRNVSKNTREQYARVNELLTRLKSEPCADCGQRFPPVAMDFDHVRGKKRAIVSQLRAHSIPTIMKEIAKCDLVCANCHRIRTARRLQARGRRVRGLEPGYLELFPRDA